MAFSNKIVLAVIAASAVVLGVEGFAPVVSFLMSWCSCVRGGMLLRGICGAGEGILYRFGKGNQLDVAHQLLLVV